MAGRKQTKGNGEAEAQEPQEGASADQAPEEAPETCEYIYTVNKATNQILKVEEVDSESGERKEVPMYDYSSDPYGQYGGYEAAGYGTGYESGYPTGYEAAGYPTGYEGYATGYEGYPTGYEGYQTGYEGYPTGYEGYQTGYEGYPTGYEYGGYEAAAGYPTGYEGGADPYGGYEAQGYDPYGYGYESQGYDPYGYYYYGYGQ